MVFLGGWAFLMSETTLYAHLQVVEVAKWSAAAWLVVAGHFYPT